MELSAMRKLRSKRRRGSRAERGDVGVVLIALLLGVVILAVLPTSGSAALNALRAQITTQSNAQQRDAATTALRLIVQQEEQLQVTGQLDSSLAGTSGGTTNASGCIELSSTGRLLFAAPPASGQCPLLETKSSSGAVQACPSPPGAAQCWEGAWEWLAGSAPSSSVIRHRQLQLQVLLLSNCRGNTTSCDLLQMDQALHRRDFLDYLYFTEHDRLPSALVSAKCSSLGAACEYPVYQTQDHVSGAIRTDSAHVWVCGTPSFEGGVFATGTPVLEQAWQLPGLSSSAVSQLKTACGTSTPTGGTTAGSLQLPASDQHLQAIAQRAGSAYALDSSSCVELNGRQIDVWTDTGSQPTTTQDCTQLGTPTELPFPATGVLWVSGNAYVWGVDGGGLTIAASGDIRVLDNLTLACAPAVPASAQALQAACATSDDLLGLVANQAVVVQWHSGTAAQQLDAAVLSLQGETRISSAANLSADACPTTQAGQAPTCPTLWFLGAMASEYRGVFGGYSSLNGQLLAGFAKQFVYDPRLRHQQPPWMLLEQKTSGGLVDDTAAEQAQPCSPTAFLQCATGAS